MINISANEHWLQTLFSQKPHISSLLVGVTHFLWSAMIKCPAPLFMVSNVWGHPYYNFCLTHCGQVTSFHYNDVIMSTMASQITSLTIVCSTVCSRHRSKKTSKLCVTGLFEGNSQVTGEFPTQRASNVENISLWWLHHLPTTIWVNIGSGNCLLSVGVVCTKPLLEPMSMGHCSIHPKAISQEMLTNFICNMCSENMLLKLLPHSSLHEYICVISSPDGILEMRCLIVYSSTLLSWITIYWHWNGTRVCSIICDLSKVITGVDNCSVPSWHWIIIWTSDD